MSSERLLSIFELMASRERHGVERGLLCGVATEVLGVDGAGIALSTDDLPMAVFCASDAKAQSLLDLEITVNEGPCSSAMMADAIVTESHLSASMATRWMLYTPQALEMGARSVFGFPVRIGAIRLGALFLYGENEQELREEQFSDALLLSTVVGRSIVALQAGAPPESLSQELQNEASFDFSVHQAAGMIAVQGAMSITNALIAIRMHAFSSAQTLARVSALVIARRLLFDASRQEWIEGS